jgi:hypothetical protein
MIHPHPAPDHDAATAIECPRLVSIIFTVSIAAQDLLGGTRTAAAARL